MINFAILLDTVVVVIFVYYIMETARQGFVINLVNSLRYIVTYFLSQSLSKKCAKYIYSNFISSRAEAIISQKISSLYASMGIGGTCGIEEKLDKIKEKLSFLNLEGLKTKFSKFTPEAISYDITSTFVYPIIKCIVSTVLFFFILRICKFFATQFLFALRGINKIPIVGSLNRIIGIAFGIFKAIIIIIILTGILNFIILVSENNLSFLNVSVVRNSHLAKHFFKVSNMFNLNLNN